MLALFGHEVIRLRRIRLGPLEIGSLNVGKWRELDSDEVSALRAAVGIVDGGGKGGSQ
jgi:23S rRNA pseudouridine2605 synthase